MEREFLLTSSDELVAAKSETPDYGLADPGHLGNVG